MITTLLDDLIAGFVELGDTINQFIAYLRGLVSSLPQQLIVTPDVYTEEMDATTGWTAIKGTVALNTTQVHSGSGSLKVTSTTTAGDTVSSIEKTGTWDFSADQGKTIQFWVYPHSDLSTITEIRIIAYSGSTANYYSVKYAANTLMALRANQWNMQWGCTWLATGSPSWANITKILIRAYHPDGVESEYSLDLLTGGFVSKPATMITFDDGDESIYTKAYPLLKAKNMVATCYFNSDDVGINGRMTSSQLQELHAAGWDIANHGASHANFTLLTQQEVEDELEICGVWLETLGLTRASKHVAYPYGEYNETAITALTSWGAKTGRELSTVINRYGSDWYRLTCFSILNTHTLDDVKLHFSNLYGVPTILNHKIIDSGVPLYGEWLASDYSDLLDYIESLGLQTLTIDEYYRLYSGPITVHHK